MRNINQATRGYAHRLLQCLTVAVRPLRLEELAEVLAFDFDDASGGIPRLNADWRREDQEQAVLSTCFSLITVVHDGESRVVQFSHFSVKEYLTSDRLAAAVGDISFHHIPLAPAHTILAQACLGVLLQLDDCTRESHVKRFPLVEYAARYWVDHAQFEGVSFRMKHGIEDLFDRDRPHFSRWIQVYDIAHSVVPNDERLGATLLYYAALCGFSDVVEKILHELPEDVNARGGFWGTALHAASSRNRVKTVQLLLKRGADVNDLGQRRWTPLHVASRYGNFEIAQWLLDYGADVNAKDKHHWTPLHGAANHGRFEVVRTLLRHNPDINAQNYIPCTPLYLASISKCVSIVRLLLDSGANPNEGRKGHGTPLHQASYNGNLEIAHLLVEGGTDVAAEDETGRTAYQIALDQGHFEIAQLLSGHSIESKK